MIGVADLMEELPANLGDRFDNVLERGKALSADEAIAFLMERPAE